MLKLFHLCKIDKSGEITYVDFLFYYIFSNQCQWK